MYPAIQSSVWAYIPLEVYGYNYNLPSNEASKIHGRRLLRRNIRREFTILLNLTLFETARHYHTSLVFFGIHLAVEEIMKKIFCSK